MTITFQTWIWFLTECLIKVVLTGLIWRDTTKYKKQVGWFLGFSIADTIDYLLTYNSVWFTLVGVAVSMNTVSAITLLTIVTIMTITELEKKEL